MQLYSCDGNAWSCEDVYGAAMLVKDSKSSLSIEIVYLEPWQEEGELQTLWRHALYFGFEKGFKQLDDQFYAFESDKCIYGLAFADAKEGKAFAAAVAKHAPKMQKRLLKERSGSSFKLFGFASGGGKKGSGKKELTVDDMSDPTDFQHLMHIGFNPLTGAFEPHNVPPEWAALFAKAGLSSRDLQDRETATYVAKFVDSNPAFSEPMAKTRAAPPPPPPPKAAPVEANVSDQSNSSNIPDVPAERMDLLASIRNASIQSLRPTEKRETPSPSVSSTGGSSDVMANMLAKALAERNQKVAAGTHTLNAFTLSL